jgi:hypothetical protein
MQLGTPVPGRLLKLQASCGHAELRQRCHRRHNKYRVAALSIAGGGCKLRGRNPHVLSPAFDDLPCLQMSIRLPSWESCWSSLAPRATSK